MSKSTLVTDTVHTKAAGFFCRECGHSGEYDQMTNTFDDDRVELGPCFCAGCGKRFEDAEAFSVRPTIANRITWFLRKWNN